MKRRLFFAGLIAMSLALVACGGSPGVPSVNAIGRVLNISTGAQFSVAATVQTTIANSQTSVVDGSFLVRAPRNATSLTVLAPSSAGFPAFPFRVAPMSLASNDVGDLWVGPEKVRVTGVVRNASNSTGVPGATVRFGGHVATTNGSGQFSIEGVAYSSANTASFLGLVGQVQVTGFFANEFTAGGNTAVSGVVDVGEILMTPLDSDSPPGLPYTIWGRISPTGSAPNTIVTLKAGATPIRRFTVGTDARYQFWVPPGSYTVEFQNGTLSAPAQTVTLNSSTDVVRADATLN